SRGRLKLLKGANTPRPTPPHTPPIAFSTPEKTKENSYWMLGEGFLNQTFRTNQVQAGFIISLLTEQTLAWASLLLEKSSPLLVGGEVVKGWTERAGRLGSTFFLNYSN
uniref:DUF4939 domain-containing protein n=1 Tax=Gopherus agassizii TaxID=38772 RepID=A0A452IAT2_9SAUR